MEKVSRLNSDIERREEEINKLCQKTKRQMSRGAPAASVPELEELLRLPLAALEKELFLSRHELQSLLQSVSSSILEQNKVNQEIEQIEERCSAGGKQKSLNINPCKSKKKLEIFERFFNCYLELNFFR